MLSFHFISYHNKCGNIGFKIRVLCVLQKAKHWGDGIESEDIESEGVEGDDIASEDMEGERIE